ncbi:MarR family winged helix-turn-helix transcriptional regulator [Actinomycetospora sp. OC33-EN08]|uniref:MarR family winged helix-turn-helix transcriptional regulator n=1 Tax=Actinomycetospora aurantiaca TaxID=3129233 RepID=A0ABU8MS38_9PSEU
MALPVPESAAGTREDILRMLTGAPEGLSDRELAEALAELHPGIDYKAVNHQCRKLVGVGAVERVGTRPVRTRLLPGGLPDDGSSVASVAERDVPPAPDRPIRDDAAPTDDPGVSLAPTTPGLPPVQAGVLAALADGAVDPAGLTDNEIAAALAPAHPDVDPKAFNYQCRKLVKAGLVERTARSKDAPIRTRITDAGREELAGLPEPEPATEPEPEPAAEPQPEPEPAPPAVGTGPSRRPRHRPKAPSDDVARIRRSERDGDDPDDPPLRFLPFSASATVVLRERLAQRAALRAVPEPPQEVVLPVRDVLQGWSRTQNVAAAVASWLERRGATVRRVSGQGPALDLVASLDGDDVHVEVTGWPPDGARTHPSTLAADWFRAAGSAAVQRRRAHPRSRIVVALPDTRRYRSLAADAGPVLADARAEVWFVDAAGRVQLS